MQSSDYNVTFLFYFIYSRSVIFEQIASITHIGMNERKQLISRGIELK